MAYSTSNPPVLIQQAIAGRRLWQYSSTDAATAVDVDGYITNASALGMEVGDLVWVLDTDASPPAASLHSVVAINANGSADLGDGQTLGTTDTD